MLNQCILTGNLGGDPEVFYSSEGNPVTSFSLAFHSSNNNERTHQGKRCQGRTSMATFLEGKRLFAERNLSSPLAA